MFEARHDAQQVNVAGNNAGTITATTVHEAPPPPVPVVRSTLRRDVSVLVGRDREVELIVAAAEPGQVVSIHTVDGMPGVGKTALVTRAAHRLADRFADGRYFVDLYGHAPGREPADPGDVLGGLLVGLGVDPGNLPDTMEGRRDLWRDRLTGKRVLLVLDDAVSGDQIEPLIPTGPGCSTLVTSRRRLVALDGAVTLTLAPLEPDHAARLFIALARRPAESADSPAVQGIVRSCGYLPLAIVLLAGRLAHHPTWTIPMLAAAFEATDDRLGEFEAGSRAVRAAFTMSYRDLPPQRQWLFRYLGLHPGPDTDTRAAAALADIPVRTARAELEALYDDHLVEETEAGRYRLHDLLREYARTLADTDDHAERNRLATDRLLDYYQIVAASADQHIARFARPAAQPVTMAEQGADAPGFVDELEALAWMRTERANLLACVESACRVRPARAAALIGALGGFLERDGPRPYAADLHRRAVTLTRSAADTVGEAMALSNLGMLCEAGGDYTEAIELHRRALSLYRAGGNRIGEANALGNLGTVRQSTGQFAESADLLQRALTLYREIGNPLGEANSLTVLGVVRQLTGDYGEGVELHERALMRYRGIGSRLGEATTLMILGLARMWTGDPAGATELSHRALALHRSIGNWLGEANALLILGIVSHTTGDHTGAYDLLWQALILHRELGNRLGEANSLNQLGSVHRVTGHYTASADLHQRALIITREIGNPLGEVDTLNEIGKLLTETDDLHGALRTFTDALDLACRIDSRLARARALEGAGRARATLGDTDRAVHELRQAVEIYEDLHSPEAVSAATHLAALEHPEPFRQPGC